MKNTEDILKFKPTQFAVGMLEVDEKILEFKKLSKKELKKKIRDTPVPVVVSHEKELYVVDHHHFLCVCYHLGVRKVRYEVVKDFSDVEMTFAQFWKWMNKNRSVYPFCQFGEGPRNALYLPKDIRGLADDPYRSLAWYVRKSGGFENSDKNFAEFQWANYFRSKKILDKDGTRGFAKALIVATRLANSKSARHLPGYGKLNLGDQSVVEKKARKRGLRAQKTMLTTDHL